MGNDYNSNNAIELSVMEASHKECSTQLVEKFFILYGFDNGLGRKQRAISFLEGVRRTDGILSLSYRHSSPCFAFRWLERLEMPCYLVQ